MRTAPQVLLVLALFLVLPGTTFVLAAENPSTATAPAEAPQERIRHEPAAASDPDTSHMDALGAVIDDRKADPLSRGLVETQIVEALIKGGKLREAVAEAHARA